MFVLYNIGTIFARCIACSYCCFAWHWFALFSQMDRRVPGYLGKLYSLLCCPIRRHPEGHHQCRLGGTLCIICFTGIARVFSLSKMKETHLIMHTHLYASTVPTFNSCTKCMGSPGIIHDRTTIAAQPTWVIDVLGLLFWHVIHGCLYNRALADVQSTGAGIKCLYCKQAP